MKRGHKNRKDFTTGSALILVVMLMSILGIIGVLFLMAARVDELSTKSINQEKALDAAVESIVSKLAAEIVLDTPGITDPNKYYDYPDSNDPWLASLEPYDRDGNPVTTTDIYWDQISDLTQYIRNRGWLTQNINPQIVSESKKIVLNSDGSLQEQPADADGDGVGDSKWIELEDLSSGTGKTIYAAVRVIDNGGMLNVNTSYLFDPNRIGVLAEEIDGSSLMQINLAQLNIQPPRGKYASLKNAADAIHKIRCGTEPLNTTLYENNVVWRDYIPSGTYYTPFDISDELELRNRFFLKQNDSYSRIKGDFWVKAYNWGPYVPRTNPGYSISDPNDWFWYVNNSGPDVDSYDYKHISTIYNADRIINPNGAKLVNINNANVTELYSNIRVGILETDESFPDVNRISSQLAVNIIDYRDNDANVTFYPNPDDGVTYYGFEVQPFISEIAVVIDGIDPTDPNNNAFALELYNPFNIPITLDSFEISISNGNVIPLNGITINANAFYVITNNSGRFPVADKEDTSLVFSGNYIDTTVPIPDGIFEVWDNYNITLIRAVGGTPIVLDVQATVHNDFAQGSSLHRERDTGNWHVVYDTMNPEPGSLGTSNSAVIGAKNYNLSIANKPFVTVGDVVRPLILGPGTLTIGQQLASAVDERNVRIDLAPNDPDIPYFQQVFKYITVFDPTSDGIDNDGDGTIDNSGEKKIYGRININTAPRFVIEQLPWIDRDLAEAIVAYRDKLKSSGPDYSSRSGNMGFASIGELNLVKDDTAGASYSIRKYALDAIDLSGFPDLTYSDGAINDFEERDVIFSRISNLVTVRSDVFTAYILVRLGADGPQKRMIAILDRSNVYNGSDKVKIIALHPVADPR